MFGSGVTQRFVGWLASAFALGALALPLSGCGEESVDQESLESGMLEIAEQTADVESASCPDDVSTEKGTEFECTVTNVKGQEVPVTATVTGQDGDDILFEIQTVDGVDVTQ